MLHLSDMSFLMETIMTYIIENDDPMIYLKAVRSSDSNRWLEVIKSKINSVDPRNDFDDYKILEHEKHTNINLFKNIFIENNYI